VLGDEPVQGTDVAEYRGVSIASADPHGIVEYTNARAPKICLVLLGERTGMQQPLSFFGVVDGEGSQHVDDEGSSDQLYRTGRVLPIGSREEPEAVPENEWGAG